MGLRIDTRCSARRIVLEVIIDMALASIHLVKYSKGTKVNFRLPCAVGSGPTMSSPQRCSGQVCAISFVSCKGCMFEARISDMLRTNGLPGWPCTQSPTNRNLDV
jgi:hypothetical protein